MLEKGTKVWYVDNNHPEFKLLEGIIYKYNQHQLSNSGEILEYYVVYIAEYDKSFWYHRDVLYTNQIDAIQARINNINIHIQYEKENIEEYTKDIEHIQNDIYKCKTKINKLEKLLVDEYNISV